ncbi:hypothetical protein ANN_03864 [Periplaneta americana]|uniref:C2H2-type domain-containing protein n=1 Tax=Periplaneta americana TaxID=6978 RepID=A0ABQ8U019_PERAM|nr:hypothetical protein ANN_03864 [Periplaneta americana]
MYIFETSVLSIFRRRNTGMYVKVSQNVFVFGCRYTLNYLARMYQLHYGDFHALQIAPKRTFDFRQFLKHNQTIFSGSENELQLAVYKLNEIAKKFNMTISESKSKVMAFNGKDHMRCKISINDSIIEQEGTLQNTHVAWIKVECVDPSYDRASEVKVEDNPAPVTDSVVKFESEEESCDEETVKEELKEEITTEEDEVFSKCSLDAHYNGVAQKETSQCYSVAKEDSLTRSTESCVSAVKSDRQVHNKCHTKKTNTESISHKGDGSIKCNICGKTFGYVQNLRKHLLTHTGEKPFKCDVCLKCFSQSGDLIKHARKHTGERPFKCEVCGKCFSYSGNLKIHVRHHTGEKPFQCDVCGKCFSESGKLKIHVRHHTGEKPFKCDICGKCLSYSGNLKIHLRQHTGEKPFQCHVCCKSFSDSGKLKIHARQHTGEKPFKCEVCGKGFAQSGNLKIHVRRHTGEKPFKCDACGKLFSQSGTLKMHIRQHTGEKPYKCDVCGKCFSETGSLKKHVIQHVGETFNCDVIR